MFFISALAEQEISLRNVALMVLSTAAFLPGVAYAQCRPMPVQVNVITPEPQVVLSSPQNVAMAAGNPAQLRASAPSGWHINGLAQAKPTIDLKMQGEAVPGCYRPRVVTVTIGFNEPIQVFIAGKYRPGSCEYENIRQHEMQHVRIYRNSIMNHAGSLQFDINRAVGTLTPQQLSSTQAQQLAFNQVFGAASGVFNRMMEESRRLNAPLDTVENYRMEQARCSNW